MKALIFDRPALILCHKKIIITPSVVVLIPPPVLPGDAPTNIRIKNIVKLVVLIEAISTVLKPSVVEAETD